MDILSVLEKSRLHGYRNIPFSHAVLREAEIIDKEGDADISNLLDLAAMIETVEKNPDTYLTKKDQIDLYDTDPMKGVCLSLWSDDVEKIERFRSHCYVNLPKGLNWFHQCNGKAFQMFEFWNPQTTAMHTIATTIANEMRMPLVTCLTKVYRPGTVIHLEPFRAFDPDMCQRGNFY